MAEPDQAGVVIHRLRNEFTVDVSVNGLRRPPAHSLSTLPGSAGRPGRVADAEGVMAMLSSARDASLACGPACGPACGQHDLQNLPGPIPARDRECAGLETVEEVLDQGGTSYADCAIAGGGERGSLGCRARRVTDPATGAGHEGAPGVERRHNGHASTWAHQ